MQPTRFPPQNPARLTANCLYKQVRSAGPEETKNSSEKALRYDAVNAMLLNEFLKEHRTVNELRATVAQQQKQLEVLSEGLQKVSAQLELNKAAPQTVLNDN
jgi:phage-related protein